MANSITIQIRGDTAANWTSKNPVPKDRELCYDKTNNQLKTGDGTTAWNNLKYTPEIVNGLTSTSANAALSAAQGKALADRITTLENKPSGGSSVNVINNLTSTSTTDALSAAQGKALNDKIPTLSNDMYSTSMTTAASSLVAKSIYDIASNANTASGSAYDLAVSAYNLANTANGKIPSGTILTSSNYSNYISVPSYTTDTWTFTLSSGSTVSKTVMLKS